MSRLDVLNGSQQRLYLYQSTSCTTISGLRTGKKLSWVKWHNGPTWFVWVIKVQYEQHATQGEEQIIYPAFFYLFIVWCFTSPRTKKGKHLFSSEGESGLSVTSGPWYSTAHLPVLLPLFSLGTCVLCRWVFMSGKVNISDVSGICTFILAGWATAASLQNVI